MLLSLAADKIGAPSERYLKATLEETTVLPPLRAPGVFEEDRMAITDNGEAKGKDAEKKAAEDALKKAKEDLLAKGEDDSYIWDGPRTQLTITVEAPVDDDSGQKAKWKLTIDKANGVPGLTAKHTAAVADITADLCDKVFEEKGELKATGEKPGSKATAFNEVIDKVKDTIANRKCAVACPNKRVQLSVTFKVEGSGTGGDDTVVYRVKWVLHIYCFDASDEKV